MTADWNACVSEPFGPLRWIECHPGLSSYIQAVGVLITLGLTIYISARDRSQARAKLVRRAAGILSSLLGEIVSLQADTERTLIALDRHLITPPNGFNYLPWFDEIVLSIPADLSAAVILVSDIPGPSAELVVDAVAAARSYNGHVARYRTAAQRISGQEWFDVVTLMKENLELVDNKIAAFFKVLDGQN